MRNFSVPESRIQIVQEASRLAALHAYDILDSLPEKAFQDIVELASLICNTPIAQVSFVDADRQWIKASFGFEATDSARAFSFCAHTLPTKATLVVEDASSDKRFQENPLVLGPPYIRSYAGSPILDDDQQVLGTVCVVDTAARSLSTAQIAALEALARQAMLLLKQRKLLIDQGKRVEAELSRNQQSLTAAGERLRLSQAAGRIASWEWDLVTGILSWSGGTEWVYGRPASELSTLDDILPFLHPDDSPRVMTALQPALNGTGEYNFEFRVLWPDGTVHWSQAFGKPLVSAAGIVERIFGVHMDITAKKRAEERVLQNEKLAAVGRISSSIAHELNNPLASVTTLLYLAETSESIQETRVLISTAREELDRASAIATQTLRFHKPSTLQIHVFLPDVLAGVILLLRHRINDAQIQVTRRDRVVSTINCFEGEIRQVITNLIGNAIDALTSSRRRLCLRTRPATDWATGRKGQAITVADSGSGIATEDLAKIFEAFFTTKELSGTGLGLWVTKEIVDRHHGHLSVRSCQEEGRRGTVFILFLPSDGEQQKSALRS